MPHVKPICILTSANVEKLSRHDLLDWVNKTVKGQYKKVEELCSGVAYCQMMEQMFPNSINSKRIKLSAKLEHEFLHNLKLLQLAFTRYEIEKAVPIERLLKARFQDNLEFLQWFKKFYDAQAVSSDGGAAAAAASMLKKANAMPVLQQQQQQKTNDPPSPDSVTVLQEDLEQLREQAIAMGIERDMYFDKLQAVERIIKHTLARQQHVAWCNKALNILYSKNMDEDDVEDDAVAAGTEM